MRPTDIEAIAELLGEAAEATGGVAEETHQAIAKRAFAATGRAARPVQAIHDAIAGFTYGSVRVGLKATFTQAGKLAARNVPVDAPALGDGIGDAVALGALHGFVGDLLDERGSALATPLSLRVGGRAVIPTRAFADLPAGDGAPEPSGAEVGAGEHPKAVALAVAYPGATPRLAVFLHGLCETEHAWRGLPKLGDRPRHTPFPDGLQADLGLTPLLIRFNSGRHISDNARDLAVLLRGIVEHWPVPVTDVTLIGHSMGGLVARSAAWQDRDERWTGLVRHIVCLGTPHHGADLEQGVHLLDWALGQTAETKAFSRLLRLRSSGIKDLRFGSATEEDWLDLDPDELVRRRAAEVPFLPHAEYCWVSATLTPGRVGHLLGDLLVRTPSASGTGKGHHVPFEVDNGATLHGLTHFDLLDHPAVYEQLVAWLSRPSRLPAPS
ncbi:MAG: alpha/beta hydrolase [Patulibacter minatonensis]